MKDEKDLTVEERMLKFQEDSLAFQREQLKVQAEQAKAQLIVSEETAKRLKPKSLTIDQVAQRSAFNPRGEKSHPLPRLQCEIYAPWKLDPNGHSLTREEVELCNLLVPGEFDFELNDGSMAVMRIEGVKNDATGLMETLHLKPNPPWNQEHKQRFPPLVKILRDVLGEKATPILSMKREKALIADGQLAVSVHG